METPLSSLDAIRDALVWAAGGPGNPDLGALDHATLIEALAQHRLEGRALSRARNEGRPLPQLLEEHLVGSHARIVQRVHDQIELFRKVRDSISHVKRGPGLVAVKGFSLYALTKHPAHASHSADVDVLGEDPHEVARAVEATGGAGFHFHGEEHPYVFAHMDDVEVHTRYVVTGMPPGLSVDVQRVSGPVELRTSFSITSVLYPDLVDLLVPGTGVAEGIEVLSPEMAVLIRCAHVYVGFAMNTQPLPWATVRLEELAQMRDYLSLDSFDAARFRALHQRYDAGLVTDFARRLHLDLFGEDPFHDVLEDGPAVRSSFPRNLWWDGIDAGFPVEIPWDARSLVGCADDHGDLAELLGPSEVTLPVDGAVSVSFLESGAPDTAERYVLHRYHGGLAFVRVALVDAADGLRITVAFPPLADSQMAAIGWATGSFRYELFYRPSAGTHEFADYSSFPVETPPSVEGCTTGADGVTLTMSLPWRALGLDGPLAPTDTLPLTFRARVQERPWGAVIGGVVAPLRVRR
ncbi:nucleotidyltransferase family protein [Cellulomonas cellasea]|uniref:nucleotidyltransferase family protein n=1 Tax=Cellulomonas cellasea TaxID=43670 RepID=UPI0025A4B017|nr:nucleotidyltransferase family protein [Cellulomonas cellasea]MDM8085106.1 nucleotidyltransferase family protein [Cellulomonas cellasea]